MESVHILGLVYGENHFGLINVPWKRKLHKYSVHGIIVVEVINHLEKLSF
ncbi:unknown [Bacteroides sp. CAG:1060]|nr:unknown [Bacteroides sp. CAG:1060]